MVYLQTDFIWHIFAAELTDIMITLHDFLPQFPGSKLSLIFTVPGAECTCKINLCKLSITIFNICIATVPDFVIYGYSISCFYIILLPVPNLVAYKNKMVSMYVIQYLFISPSANIF